MTKANLNIVTGSGAPYVGMPVRIASAKSKNVGCKAEITNLRTSPVTRRVTAVTVKIYKSATAKKSHAATFSAPASLESAE